MAKPPICPCGCKTPLNPRKDGTFATYAPGGHDARHKSQLIKAVLDNDDPKAMEILKGRGWDKFLDKARAVRDRRAKASAHKSDPARNAKPATRADESMRFGLTERDINLLVHPPNENTWFCTGLHGYGAHDPERLIPNKGSDLGTPEAKNDRCWFCQSTRPADAPMVWPLFLEALGRLEKIDLEDLMEVGRIQDFGDTLAWRQRAEAPEDMLLARKILALHRKYVAGGDDKSETTEVPDGAALDLA